MRTRADRHEPWPELEELDPAGFGRRLEALLEVYAAAMDVPAAQLPGRRAVMEAHAVNPGFRALVVTAPPGSPPGPALSRARRGDKAIVAFGYGFHGDRGQWWHDLVRAALTAAAGARTAAAWLDDSFEVAELHVRPDHQKRGIGRRLLYRLTGGLGERTAVLSTMDYESPARRLYRSLGFTDLLTTYQFAGVAESYAVMGAVLPLGGAAPSAAAPEASTARARPPRPRY